MQELEALKVETDDLDDNVSHSLKSDFKSNSKRTIRIVVLVVIVIAALFFIAHAMSECEAQQEIRDFQTREAFRDRYFEEFDRLYESGDDAALSDYIWSLSDDPGFEALFSWKHVGYLDAYNDWEALKAFERETGSGSLDIEDYAWAVSTAIRLAYPDSPAWHQTYTLTEAEELRATPYRSYARQFLRDTLQMDDSEVASFVDACTDDRGDLVDDDLKSALEQRLKKLGIL